MSKTNPHITDAELEILKQLWESPGASVRELTESIYGQLTTSRIGSVQKLIQRLETKNLIERDRSGFAHKFSALVTEADVAGMQLDELAQKVTGGSLLPFISHLIRGKRLSPQEQDEIRKLLDQGD